jgi:hypothetical protein
MDMPFYPGVPRRIKLHKAPVADKLRSTLSTGYLGFAKVERSGDPLFCSSQNKDQGTCRKEGTEVSGFQGLSQNLGPALH